MKVWTWSKDLLIAAIDHLSIIPRRRRVTFRSSGMGNVIVEGNDYDSNEEEEEARREDTASASGESDASHEPFIQMSDNESDILYR